MTPDHPGGRTSPRAPYQTEAGGPEAGVRVMPARAKGSGKAVETGGRGDQILPWNTLLTPSL